MMFMRVSVLGQRPLEGGQHTLRRKSSILTKIFI